VSVESDSLSSEYSDSEMASMWAGNKNPRIIENNKQSGPFRAKSASPVICPSGNHSITVAADVHCSLGGTKAVRQGMQKPALSARAASEPPNPDKMAEDNDFTVIAAKTRQGKTKVKPTVSETAINTVCHPLPLLRVMFLVAQSTRKTNS
jgi:hypothetical protein